MIIFLEGVMGSGKTYEAVKFHIIPALISGRKVVTNVPLHREKLAAVYGFQVLDLIDIRENKKNADGTYYIAFDSLDDFKDTWKHPVTKQGALYVIDECHIPISNIRNDRSHQLYIEATMQRHSRHDWVLITQDISGVYQPIAKLAQSIHYMRKRLSLGLDRTYFHFAYDGNTKGKSYIEKDIRRYDLNIFLFYNSHTLSDDSGKEQLLTPFSNNYFKMYRFPIIFILLLILYFAYLYFDRPAPNIIEPVHETNVIDNSVVNKVHDEIAVPASSQISIPISKNDSQVSKIKSETKLPQHTKNFIKENDNLISNDVVNILPYEQSVYNRAVIKSKEEVKRPAFDDYVIQIKGFLIYKKSKEFIYKVFSNNGVSDDYKESDLKKLGYSITVITDCVQILDHPNAKEPVYLTCHTPVFNDDDLPSKSPKSKVTNSLVDSITD